MENRTLKSVLIILSVITLAVVTFAVVSQQSSMDDKGKSAPTQTKDGASSETKATTSVKTPPYTPPSGTITQEEAKKMTEDVQKLYDMNALSLEEATRRLTDISSRVVPSNLPPEASEKK